MVRSSLTNAIALYRKLGFAPVPGPLPSWHDRRSDIAMELDLDEVA